MFSWPVKFQKLKILASWRANLSGESVQSNIARAPEGSFAVKAYHDLPSAYLVLPMLFMFSPHHDNGSQPASTTVWLPVGLLWKPVSPWTY
jgi:hypothetical protein